MCRKCKLYKEQIERLKGHTLNLEAELKQTKHQLREVDKQYSRLSYFVRRNKQQQPVKS